jgi:hypothetical protein
MKTSPEILAAKNLQLHHDNTPLNTREFFNKNNVTVVPLSTLLAWLGPLRLFPASPIEDRHFDTTEMIEEESRTVQKWQKLWERRMCAKVENTA